MVGDDAEPDVVDVAGLPAGVVAPPRQLLDPGDDGAEQVGLVDVVHTLQQERDALDPESGVDVALRELAHGRVAVLGALGPPHVLHEHEVPDLEVAVLVGDGAARDPVLRTAVVVDLGAGSAGAGDAHVPVVVEPVAALDPLRREPGDLAPEPLRLVVVLVDGDPDALRVEAEAALVLGAGDQRPGVADRPVLEVVAEGEVAGHLEERVVAGGVPDVLDVAGADALLDRRGPRVGGRRVAEEVGLELHHPGVDEQQRRVVEDQRGAGDGGVAGGLEVGEEASADLVGLHGVPIGWRGPAGSRRVRWRTSGGRISGRRGPPPGALAPRSAG